MAETRTGGPKAARLCTAAAAARPRAAAARSLAAWEYSAMAAAVPAFPRTGMRRGKTEKPEAGSRAAPPKAAGPATEKAVAEYFEWATGAEGRSKKPTGQAAHGVRRQ